MREHLHYLITKRYDLAESLQKNTVDGVQSEISTFEKWRLDRGSFNI